MATIVQFSEYVRKAAPKAVLSQSADIVLFHGIRYQRWDEKMTPETAVGTKSRRRKSRKAAVNQD